MGGGGSWSLPLKGQRRVTASNGPPLQGQFGPHLFGHRGAAGREGLGHTGPASPTRAQRDVAGNQAAGISPAQHPKGGVKSWKEQHTRDGGSKKHSPKGRGWDRACAGSPWGEDPQAGLLPQESRPETEEVKAQLTRGSAGL